MKCKGLWFHRDQFETTKPGDSYDSWELGPLKAYFYGVRIPVWFALLLPRPRRVRGGNK
jgi:hypothetical protein